VSEFKIPKRIQLTCYPVDVVFENDLVAKSDRQGEARYRQNQIAIQASTESFPLSDIDHVSTYFHELMHWILFLTKNHKLDENEDFVDQVAMLLAQAALSAEYK